MRKGSPKAGMLKASKSKRKLDSQNTVGGVPEIIWTLLELFSRSLTRNSAKLAESEANAIIVNRTSSKSPAKHQAACSYLDMRA